MRHSKQFTKRNNPFSAGIRAFGNGRPYFYYREEQNNMETENATYSVKIGKTTFIVCVKQSETAKKPLEKVFRDMCKHEVLGDFGTDNSSFLKNITKVS